MYAIILLSTAVTVSSQLVEFVAFAAVLAFVTWLMLRLYLPTATKIKAIVSDTAGSLVGLTAESLEGLEVIQAYQHEDYFVNVRFLTPCFCHFLNMETLSLLLIALIAVIVFHVCIPLRKLTIVSTNRIVPRGSSSILVVCAGVHSPD